MRTCLILATAAVLAGPTLAHAETLDLVCRGQTRAYEQGGATVFNHRGGETSALTRVDSRADEFRLRLDGADARVAPPPALIPWLTGAGLGDGWWGLTGLEVSDNRITGTYSHSLIYSPKVTIDRRTGAISVRALVGDEFTGVCEPAADAAGRRF